MVKIQAVKSIKFNITLDSSESTMFNQGGMHKLDITEAIAEEFENPFDKVEMTFQMDRMSKGLFDFVNNEAAKHRKEWDAIYEEERIKKEKSKDSP
jgi:hypothetical protein